MSTTTTQTTSPLASAEAAIIRWTAGAVAATEKVESAVAQEASAIEADPAVAMVLPMVKPLITEGLTKLGIAPALQADVIALFTDANAKASAKAAAS